MSRLILSLLLLTICTVADQEFVPFAERTAYLYDYTARVATGIAGEVKQSSGFEIKGKLSVQDIGYRVLFHLHSITIGDWNKKTSHGFSEDMDIEHTQPSEKQGGPYGLNSLFLVEYDNGLIKKIYLSNNVNSLRRNNQKALASLFQLRFKQEYRRDPNFYINEEDGIGGFCETTYLILEDQEGLNVTKHREFDSCENSPQLFYSSIQGRKFTDNKHANFEPLKRLANVRYRLKGNRQKYIIEHIEAMGLIDFSPFTTNGQSILSIVNQTLHLTDIYEDPPEPAISHTDPYDRLSYEFENEFRYYDDVNLKQAHYYNRIFPIDNSDSVIKAEKVFQELQEEFQKDNAIVAKYVIKIIDVLTEFNFEDFVKFFENHIFIKHPKGAQHLVVNALPLVGTNPSIIFAFYIIKENKVGKTVAEDIIQFIPFNVKKPSKNLIEATRDFISNENIASDPLLFASSQLAYGSLLSMGCIKNDFTPKSHDDDCKIYLTELKKNFHAASDDSIKAVYLEAIINSRLDHEYNLTYSIITGSYDVILKQIALKGMDLEDPKSKNIKIVEAIFKIYINPKEDYVLRISAFNFLLPVYPTSNLFANTILIFKSDSNEKLKSFIYAYLTGFANSTSPDVQPYRQHIKHLLKYIEYRHRDAIKDSSYLHFSMQNAKYNYGRHLNIYSVPSNESLFPRELYFDQSMNFLDYNFDLLQVGFISQGRLFQESDLRRFGTKYEELHHPSKSIAEFIEKTLKKINYPRRYENDKNSYQFFVKYLDRYIFTTRNILQAFLGRGPNKGIEYIEEEKAIKFDVNYLRYLDIELVIPNELGMPVSFQSRVPLITYIRGSSQAVDKAETTIPVMEHNIHYGMDLRIESRIAVLSELFGPLGYRVTTKVGLHLPIKGYLNFNEKNDMIEFYLPSTESYDILYYKTKPETIGKTNVPVRHSSKSIQKQYDYGHDYFGLGVTYNFTYDYMWNDYGSYRNFFKSFFKKPSSYERYQYLSEKLYAEIRNFLDFALMNPTAKPFSFNIHVSRGSKNPTTEFVLKFKKTATRDIEVDTHEAHDHITFAAEVVGKGSVERKWNLDLEAHIDFPDRQFRHANIRFKRTAIPNYDDNPFEICYAANATITDYHGIYLLKPENFKIKYFGHLILGKDCKTDDFKRIDIQLVAQKSEEQLNYDITSSENYIKCMELANNDYKFNKYCWETMKTLGRLDKITVDIDHKNIPNDIKLDFHRLYQYFRHKLYSNFYLDPFHGSGRQNHITIVANHSNHHPEITDIKITRPDQTAFYKHVDIQNILPLWDPLTVIEAAEERIARKLFNYHKPTCIISGKHIKTFDGVIYNANLSQQFHLALTDTRYFFVYFRSVRKDELSKALRVIVDGSMVDVLPEKKSFKVILNGTEKIEHDKASYLTSDDNSKRGIIYVKDKTYFLTYENYGLTIFSDGINSVISVSSFYTGDLYGICGNFDGDTQGELVGPGEKIYEAPSEFVQSYAIDD